MTITTDADGYTYDDNPMPQEALDNPNVNHLDSTGAPSQFDTDFLSGVQTDAAENGGWMNFGGYADEIASSIWEPRTDGKPIFETLTPDQQVSLSQGAERRSLTEEAKGDEGEPMSLLARLYASTLGSKDQNVAGFAWKALEKMGAAYINRDEGKSRSDYYKAMSASATQNSNTAAKLADAKLAGASSTGQALANVKKPGLINYQPLPIQSMNTRVTGA